MTPMVPYRVGYYFEGLVRAWLEDHGWVVFRTGGSRSLIDLVAMRPGETILIQCKAGGRLDPRERKDLGLLSARLQVKVVLASREKTGLTFRRLRPDGSLVDGLEDTPEKRKEDYGDQAGAR